MSQVIINDIPPYTQASASGGQTVFGTTWTADAASDVYVYVTPAGDDPNDDTQILAYPADFSVSFVGALEQVQVTLVTPAALGDIVTITRQTPADRENLYSNTNFTPSMLNSDFGILTLVDQQAQLVNQLVGPRYNYSAIIEPIVDTILPILGANQGWTKNSADTAIIPIDFPSTGFAPAGGSYVTTTDESALLPDSFNLAAIGSGLLVNRTSDNTLLTTTMTGTSDQITITNGTGLTGIINAAIATNPIMPGTAGMGIPQGTSAQRIVPASGIGLRFNTDIQMVEYWNGSAWVTITDDTTLLALLASHAVNEGASLIGLQNQSNVSSKTVQDLANEVFLTGSAFSSLQNAQVLTAGSNIMLTPGAGTLTISASPGGGVNPGLINEMAYYAAAGNTLSGLTTANNSVLVTSVTGVPSLSTVLPGGLTTTDPTLAQGVATKNYVDQTSLNGTSVYAASAASLGTVTQAGSGVGATLTNAGAQAVFALDGVNPPVGSNVLIKNTATGMSAANEGIYSVTDAGSGATDWLLTRATSYDTVTEINHTGLIVVQNGSTLAGTAWYNTSTIVTVDTTNFSYSQFGNIIFPVSLAQGGTGASLTASNGGIFYSNATTGAILAGTATARQMLQSGASTTPAWSSTTWPATSTVNRILYSSATNVVGEISTINSAGLLTDGSGIPGWVAYTGTGAPVLATSPTITTPRIDNIYDSANSLNAFSIIGVASAVNAVYTTNSAIGNPVQLGPIGTDTNIDLLLTGKGTGGVPIRGVSTNSNASAGYVGEIISGTAVSTAVSLTTSIASDVTSISLTAGDWDVNGVVNFAPGGATTVSQITSAINTVSATIPDTFGTPSINNSRSALAMTFTTAAPQVLSVMPCRISIAATTTVYLIARSNFGASTMTVGGIIWARRVR